jgi:microcystin-dependent protein
MADPFVAEIRLFPFNFPPKGWAFCNGQLLPLSQNTALFSLLGTTYGGDGKSNFALPDLQGRVPLQPGQGPGLSLYDLGQTGGAETVTLLESEIPFHNHTLQAGPLLASSNLPASDRVLARSVGGNAYAPPVGGGAAPSSVQAAPTMLAPAGGDQPHNNLQPFLTLNFCIALQGVFPPRP